jgi:RHS repeat-associated protein
LQPCYQGNQQYSITALTDGGGAIKERYAYTAYGELSIFDGSGTARTSTAEGNRYTYTGREWDEDLSLYHYRARMYDLLCGRFCARDPIEFCGGINFVSTALLSQVNASSSMTHLIDRELATDAGVDFRCVGRVLPDHCRMTCS